MLRRVLRVLVGLAALTICGSGFAAASLHRSANPHAARVSFSLQPEGLCRRQRGTKCNPPPPTTSTTATAPPPTTTPTTSTGSTQSILHPYPPGSLWNAPLPANPPLDAKTAAKISYFLKNGLRSPNVQIGQFGAAVVEATGAEAKANVTCTYFPSCNVNRFGGVPFPANTYPDPSADGHLVIWDRSTHREYDFWQSKCASDCPRASNAGVFSTDQAGLGMPDGGSKAVAAALPVLPGLLRPEDVKRGYADHALIAAVYTLGVKPGHVCPATADDGNASAGADALVEGTLLQLDPSLDVDALAIPGWQRAVARTLQRYGVYIVDKGGSFGIKAENPINRGADPWSPLGMPGTWPSFSSSFPWSKLRVLAPRGPWCP